MLKRPVFSAFNIIYQIIILWCLLFANAYLNDKVVPASLLWKNNHRRIDTTGMLGHTGFKTLVLLIEAALLILITYAINSAILNDTERKHRRNAVAKRTAKTHIIITLCFIAYLIVG